MNQNRSIKQNKGAGKTVTTLSYYQGAIPDPESMERYEKISPGFAARFLAMAEEEGNYRRRQGIKGQWMAFALSALSILVALIAVVAICILCYYAFTFGFGTQGASIACSVLVALVLAFLSVRRNSTKPDTKKNPNKD